MRFLVDQPISWEVARGLCEAGHDALHVRDLGMAAAADEEIIAAAKQQNRIIVTQDTDYGALVTLSGSTKPSIVLFRMRDARPSVQSTILLRHIPDIADALDSGAIVVVEDAAIRIRLLK